jgi:hypothetical protein
MSGEGMTKSISTAINLNGAFSVTGPEHLTNEQLRNIGLTLVQQKLGLNLKCKKTGVVVSMKSGSIFLDSGHVNVGELSFDVHHRPDEKCSGAKVAIKPRPGTFGDNYYQSMMGAYVSPNEVFITTEGGTPSSERKIVSVMLDGDELCVSVGSDLNITEPCTTINLAGGVVTNN